MTGSVALSPQLCGAIEELEATFPEAEARVTADGDGGAWIVIDPVDLGDHWTPRETWVGFHLAANYPYADVYPLFISPDCRLSDGRGLPLAVSTGASIPVQTGTCCQVSRRSNRWNPTRDTVTIKVIKVCAWLAAS